MYLDYAQDEYRVVRILVVSRANRRLRSARLPWAPNFWIADHPRTALLSDYWPLITTIRVSSVTYA
jgi:hypothetical protein